MKSLLPVLQEHLSFSEVCSPFTNIITGQIYSEKITEDLLSFEETGNRVYKEFVDERLKPSRFIQTCKISNKGKENESKMIRPKNSEETATCLLGVH